MKVNDKTYDYNNNKEIGPYPKTQELTVSAEGEAKKRHLNQLKRLLKRIT